MYFVIYCTAFIHLRLIINEIFSSFCGVGFSSSRNSCVNLNYLGLHTGTMFSVDIYLKCSSVEGLAYILCIFFTSSQSII